MEANYTSTRIMGEDLMVSEARGWRKLVMDEYAPNGAVNFAILSYNKGNGMSSIKIGVKKILMEGQDQMDLVTAQLSFHRAESGVGVTRKVTQNSAHLKYDQVQMGLRLLNTAREEIGLSDHDVLFVQESLIALVRGPLR
jgi:hypothetical protein